MSRPFGDHVLSWWGLLCALVTAFAAVVITGFVFIESSPALSEIGIGRFFSDNGWHPAPDATEGEFNLAPMFAASLLCTLGAVLLAAPLGFACALFPHFYCPFFLVGVYRRMLELLAGIPSVIYGFWGLVVLVPLLNAIEPPGASLLAGILILTLMILPVAALAVDSAIAGIPVEQMQAAAAVGLSHWGTVRGVVFPHVKSSAIAAVVLQGGRAMGETMAVLMVCGNVVQWPGSPFDSARTLTANIALEMAYATGYHRSALFVSGLLLLIVAVCLVVGIETVLRRAAA